MQAIQLAVSDISFYFKDKTASIGPSEYTGRLSFTLPPKGIDVNAKLRLIPASATTTLAPVASSATPTSNVTPGSSLTNKSVPAPLTTATMTVSQRSLHRAFHVIEHLEVRITDDFEIDIKECNHSLVVAMFKPIMALRLKAALEGFVAGQFRQLLEGLDGMAYDVSERAEVFKDTGLGSGAAMGAAVWSEIGRMRRLGKGLRSGGRYTDWQATGTGVVVGERKVNLETGEDKEGEVKFAMGAEPQILSGEKRGPLGTASESLSKRLRSATGQILDDTGVEVSPDAVPDAMDAQQVVEQAKEVAEEGMKQFKSFKDTIQFKSKIEQQREGWQSSAFNWN